MVSTLSSLFALFAGFALLCLGHGLNNTLLGVRSVHEGFGDWTIALMTTAYFAGFLVGTRICTTVLFRVGHIRCFSAFASMASAVSLAYLLMLNETGWIAMRFIYGVCLAATYVSLESWLNGLATRQNRGRVMSVYMMVNFTALAAGQWLLLLDSGSGYELFLVVSILVSLALVPVSVSNRQAPHIGEAAHVNLTLLMSMNRAALLGVAGLGMALGSYWGLGAAYLSKAGMDAAGIAKFLSVGFFGGLLFQWPVGLLSDRFDRRLVIAATLVVASVVSVLIGLQMSGTSMQATLPVLLLAFFYGGSCYTLYSLLVALANDFLDPKHLVPACAGLIMLQALGALLGPLLVALLSLWGGPGVLFYSAAVIYLVMFGVSLHDYLIHRRIPASTATHFAAMPRTSPVAAQLDDRDDEMLSAQQSD